MLPGCALVTAVAAVVDVLLSADALPVTALRSVSRAAAFQLDLLLAVLGLHMDVVADLAGRTALAVALDVMLGTVAGDLRQGVARSHADRHREHGTAGAKHVAP
jgi:hypothetical protein